MDIFEASQNGNILRIDQLLQEGVDIDSKHPKYGTTPLMWAAQNSGGTSSLETVKLLLDRGADINRQSKLGTTALIMASEQSGPNGNSNIETVKLLLDRGADVNYQPITTRYTALMVAGWKSNSTSSLETVKLLLKYGANPFITINKYGGTVLNLCQTDECKQIIMWNTMYQNDKRLAKQYSSSGTMQFPKDVWELILLNKRQQELCKDLSSTKNREVLWYFAEMLNIPLDPKLTKAQLCGLISRYLAYDQYEDTNRYSFISKRINEDKRKIIELAQRFGINTNRPMEDILKDLSRLF